MTEVQSKADCSPPTAQPTPGWRGRVSYLGPGLVLAAASVGAGDMITSISGAALYGMGLLWVAALGLLIKFGVTEAVGRHYIASGTTIVAGARTVASWLPHLLFVFFLVVALIYGAGLSSVAALALSTLFPTIPVIPASIAIAALAAAVVLYGRYNAFENTMKWFILLKFGLMVTLACITLAQIDDWGGFVHSLRPTFPSGSLIDVIGLIGGVGGTAGIAAYGYWVREKKWTTPQWVPIMRLDAATSYGIVFVFVIATTIVGTGLVYGTGRSIKGADGLAALAEPLGADLGSATRVLFLVTFLMVVTAALVGGFNGLAYLLSDSLRTIRRVSDDTADSYVSEKSWVFRGFVLMSLISSVVVVFTGRPVALVLLYAAVGSLVLPILSATLLVLLNRKDIVPSLRNGLMSNAILVTALAMFVLLAAVQIMESF
ncbi:Nramp family divalent metal transporter [Rhodococcus opacus]|uniref:Nramp family divalent metal transporter n=1 Tax=Rhodococcus opacus TaxID=37919 RepID=UPI001C45214F|nr:Nramp family divalent metal transporter [Rhodococcus opacus]MBV6760449.1 Nramp family divalent metal transporter [Rhodococcus opacus]